MSGAEALNKLRQVRERYILYRLLAGALLAAAVALTTGVILYAVFSLSLFWVFLIFALVFSVLIAITLPWRVTDSAIAAFLDVAYPELEESCNLILMPATDLTLLQQLQLSKTADVLYGLPLNHNYFTKRLRVNLVLFACAIILAFGIAKLHFNWGKGGSKTSEITADTKPIVPEKVLPQIAVVDISITPPAYTRLGSRSQDKFTLDVPEGAEVNWKLKTNVATQKVSLLFDEKDEIKLKAGDNNTQWVVSKTITKPGFYQVIIDGKRSDLYQLQVIKDTPPVIQIKTPKQYTYIDAGEKPKVTLNVNIADDYGLSEAFINATIAKGSGEAVKFKEQKISFSEAISGARKYDLQKTIDLPSLGMEPGDELYFYVQAKDNHQQLTHTDVYIVSIQDTAQLLSMDGVLGTANIKPEYFRSERQIILDSESLLKAKDTIGSDKFKERANELGTDQKLLRLRYGKFLGEESENEIGDPRAAREGEPVDPKDFGNGDKIQDAYTDKHDNAEDAQFFEPAVKAQLKATLTEMWKAELQLRLGNVPDALPFEYKALRLLKDLQQKSRSYVAKTAFNPAPLKMDKRLSGDLSKIIQPADHLDIKTTDDQFDALKRSVAILDRLKNSPVLNGNDYRTLQSANLQLSNKAAAQPAVYLASVSAMRRILSGDKKNTATDLATVEQAIHRILPVTRPVPQNGSSSPDMGLSQGYYLKLNRNNR